MKERYIRQVQKALHLPRKAKAEIVRDLNEIFASAMEHGESEAQVMERLGTPKEFADAAAAQLGADNAAPQKRRRLLLLLISAALSAAAFALYAAAKSARASDGAIGQADAMTSIQVAGPFGLDAAQLLLAVGAAAAIFAVIQLVRAGRGRRQL